MTNEQKDTIATYITAFKNFLARHILPDVAIRAMVYPTSDQVLLVITLNRNNQGGTEFRHECASTEEAFQRAGVDPGLLPESDEYSHRIGVSASSIVSLKSFNPANWTTERARQVVQAIVDMIDSAKKRTDRPRLRRSPKLAVD